MSTEQYGLEINISTNVTEVQNGITGVKELLESLSNTKYEIKIDDTSIQNLKTSIQEINKGLAETIKAQSSETSKFIEKMNNTLTKSSRVLYKNSGANQYTAEKKELESLMQVLNQYSTTNQAMSAKAMSAIRERVNALKESTNTIEAEAKAQQNNAEVVTNAYQKILALQKQISNIESKANIFSATTGDTGIKSVTSELENYKVKLNELLNDTSKLGSLSTSEYTKIATGINNAKNSLTQYIATSKNTTELNTAIQKQQDALEKVKVKYDAMKSKVTSGNKEQISSYQQLAKQIDAVEKELSQVSSKTQLTSISSSIKTITNDMTKLNASIKTVTSSTAGMNDMFSRATSYFTGRLMYEASASISRAARDMISWTMDIEEKMVEMAMVTSKSMSTIRDEFDAYNKLAQDLSVTTTNVADAMITFVRQGLSVEEAMERASVAIKFAKEANIDFQESASLLTATFNAYKDTGISMEYVSDVLLKTGASAATSAEDVASAMQRTASIASSTGLEFEKLVSWIAAVEAKTQLSAEVIGSSFASMFARFTKITQTGYDEYGDSVNDMIKALNDVGIEAKYVAENGQKEWRSYADIIDEIRNKWDTFNTDTQNYIATQVAGARQKDKFISLINEYDEATKILEKIKEEAVGFTNTAYETYLQSTEASLNNLKATWESVKLAFSDTGFLSGVIDATNSFLTAFTKAPVIFTSVSIAVVMLGKQLLTTLTTWKATTVSAIQGGTAIKTAMTQSAASVVGLNTGLAGTKLGFDSAKVSAVAFNMATSIAMGAGIMLVGALVAKLLSAKSATEQLAEQMKELDTENKNLNKIDQLDTALQRHKEINEETEEKLQLETEIKSLKDEVGAMDDLYKAILENENMELETQLSLIKQIQAEKLNEQALDAKKAFIKNNTERSEVAYDTPNPTMSRTITYDEVQVNRLRDFNSLLEEQKRLQEEIARVGNDDSLSITDKAKKIEDYNKSLADTAKKLTDTANQIAKTDSEIQIINGSLSNSEDHLQRLDGIEDVYAWLGQSAVDAANDIDQVTDALEGSAEAADMAEQSANNFAKELKGFASDSDFLDAIIEEFKEFGSLSYDTIIDLVENHSQYIDLLLDEERFIENATAKKMEADAAAKKSYEDFIQSYIDGTLGAEEVASNPEDKSLEGSQNLATEGVANVNTYANNFISKLAQMKTQATSVSDSIRSALNSITANASTAQASIGRTSGISNSIMAQSLARTNTGVNTDLNDGIATASTLQTEARGIVQIRPNKPSSGSSSSSSSSSSKKNSSSKRTSSSSSKKANSTSTAKVVEDLELTIDVFTSLNQAIDTVSNTIERYQILAERANPVDRVRYLKQEIEAYEQKRNLLSQLYNQQQIELANMKKQLQAQGFIIDATGTVTNYAQQLLVLQNNANKLSGTSKENAIEAVKEIEDLVNEFISLNNEIQNTDNSIADMTNTIYSAYRSQLELISDMETKITNVIKKQIEERKSAIDDELQTRLDAINKAKDEYNNSIEEENYESQLAEEKGKLLEIQNQIDKLSKDTSLAGKKRVQELKAELEAQQKVIDDMIKQHTIDQNNKLFEEEIKRLEAEADAKKEALDKEYDDKKIYQMAQEGLSTGVFTDIYGDVVSITDALLEFEDAFGEGFSIMGDVIKKELIDNLKTAEGLMQNIGNIMGGLGAGAMTYSSTLFGDNASYKFNPPIVQSGAVTFSAPLINIEGNVDKNVISDLQGITDKVTEAVYSALANNLTLRGV